MSEKDEREKDWLYAQLRDLVARNAELQCEIDIYKNVVDKGNAAAKFAKPVTWQGSAQMSDADLERAYNQGVDAARAGEVAHVVGLRTVLRTVERWVREEFTRQLDRLTKERDHVIWQLEQERKEKSND